MGHRRRSERSATEAYTVRAIDVLTTRGVGVQRFARMTGLTCCSDLTGGVAERYGG